MNNMDIRIRFRAYPHYEVMQAYVRSGEIPIGADAGVMRLEQKLKSKLQAFEIRIQSIQALLYVRTYVAFLSWSEHRLIG
jgi:hypothetical protein